MLLINEAAIVPLSGGIPIRAYSLPFGLFHMTPSDSPTAPDHCVFLLFELNKMKQILQAIEKREGRLM